MKGNAKTHLILGIVFLAVGITMLLTGAVSRTMAYGDFVLALAFFILASHGSKKSDEQQKAEPENQNRKEN